MRNGAGDDADERADIAGEAIVVRAIAIDVRLRLRPRPIEQRQEPVMEHVEEPAERRVAGVAQPLARVLGQVQRQRTVRTEQAEQPDLQPRRGCRPAGARTTPAAPARTTDPDPVPAAPARRPDAAPRPSAACRVQALQPAQRLIEIVAVRRLRQRREEGYSVGLAPHCGTHRLISPRLSERRTVSVNELIDTCRVK